MPLGNSSSPRQARRPAKQPEPDGGARIEEIQVFPARSVLGIEVVPVVVILVPGFELGLFFRALFAAHAVEQLAAEFAQILHHCTRMQTTRRIAAPGRKTLKTRLAYRRYRI